MAYRPLTEDKKTDLSRIGTPKLSETPPTDRRLTDVLPPLPEPAAPAAAPAVRVPITPGMVVGMLACLALLGVVVFSILGQTTHPLPIATQAPARQARAAATAPNPEPVLPIFWSPNGASAGALRSTDAYTATARYGEDWIQFRLAGGGLVWARMEQAADRTPAFDALPDLAPRPESTPAPRSAIIPQAEQAPAAAPTSPPAPTACSVYVYGNASGKGESCDLEALKAQYPGGSILGRTPLPGEDAGQVDRDATAYARLPTLQALTTATAQRNAELTATAQTRKP